MISFQSDYLNTLEDIDVFEKKVFLRADLNVPMQDGKITDDKRIRAILPTLNYLLEEKARVVIASHLGRPKSPTDNRFSLLPVAELLSSLVDHPVVFSEETVGDGARHLIQNSANKLIMLENLRFDEGEQNCDDHFTKALSRNIDVFINDAFGTLHRDHASITGVPHKVPIKGIGRLVEREIACLLKLAYTPDPPFAVILGGAKVSDKIKTLERLIKKVDRLFIGGAMAFTFLKARGISIGDSYFEEEMIPYANKIMDMASTRKVPIFLPKDFQIAQSLDSETSTTTQHPSIPDGWLGLDIGPQTTYYFERSLQSTKTLFWNGPMGMFEKKPFDQGTLNLAKAIGELDCFKVIGGGDSAAAIAHMGLTDQMSHVSTGGGASLQFLRNPRLPGLEALLQEDIVI